MQLCALQVFNLCCQCCEKIAPITIFCTAISGVFCNIFSALRVAHLIHKNFIHPNIYTSNSFRKRELLLFILIKIKKIYSLCDEEVLFLARAGDMVKLS